jgi:hypothetical protein
MPETIPTPETNIPDPTVNSNSTETENSMLPTPTEDTNMMTDSAVESGEAARSRNNRHIH